MSESMNVMSLAEVAAALPTHQRHLRLILSDPGRARMAPQPLPRDGDYFRFDRRTVETWLETRRLLREQLSKPCIDWFDPDAIMDLAPVKMAHASGAKLADETAEFAATRAMRDELGKIYAGGKLPTDLDYMAVELVTAARKARMETLARSSATRPPTT